MSTGEKSFPSQIPSSSLSVSLSPSLSLTHTHTDKQTDRITQGEKTTTHELKPYKRRVYIHYNAALPKTTTRGLFSVRNRTQRSSQHPYDMPQKQKSPAAEKELADHKSS
jgi:hypothetical protein